MRYHFCVYSRIPVIIFRVVLIFVFLLANQVFSSPTQFVQARRPAAPLPGVSLTAPESMFIGSDFTFTVAFDNANAGTTGYGPFIDVVFPVNGVDGDPYGDPLADPPVEPEEQDGIDFKSATYLGQPVEALEVIFDENGKAAHPYARNPDGTYMEITGTPGDKLVSFRLPFGSIVPEQPAIELEISAHLSNLADLGAPLSLRARSGFMFGADPLDNFCCDWVVLSPASNDSADWNGPGESAEVLPALVTLTKNYVGLEAETATGPSFPREYRITATIAAGQVLNPLIITDILPSNTQFISITANPQGGVCTLPSTTTPGGTLACDFSNASGTVSLTYRFYIGYADSNGTEVIPPLTGADATSNNQARAQADWQPIDTRDDFYQDYTAGPASDLIHDEALVIQKGVANTSDAVNSPGDILRYTLSFQVSDYFVVQNVKLKDTLSDGQHFDNTRPVTLAVNGNPFTLSSVGMDADNVDAACNYSYTGALPAECDRDDPADNDGKTTLVFDVSQELIDRALQDGKLIGGCIPPAGAGSVAELAACAAYNGGTTGTITYYVVVQDEFTDDYPSGDKSVDQGDRLGNSVRIDGDLLSVTDVSTPLGAASSNASGAGLNIAQGGIAKKIFALNGSTSFDIPLKIAAGDEVTFEMTYSLPTSDFEGLVLTDYFPLPVFNVSDDFGSGTGRYTNDLCSALYPATGTPPAGYACLGSGDSYHLLADAVSPSLTVQPGANSIQFGYGDYDIASQPTTKINLLFTARVSNAPFADLLYLTNQARGQEGSTNAQDTQSDSIVQIVLTEPYLVGSKGVIASDNPNAILTPDPAGPVTFNTAGTPGAPWSGGVINSDGLAATPIGSDIATVDAGDLVRFAIVVENLGSGANGAFDIRVKDILPTDFEIPVGGLNLTVTRGDGTMLNFTYLGSGPDGIDGTDDDLFGGGIEISDDPELGSCQHYDPLDGRNIALITYDLQVAADVKPNTTITNGGTLFRYAADEGGPDFTGDDNDQTFSADTLTTVPAADKTLSASSVDQTDDGGPNTLDKVTVGEVVEYETVLTIPEGELPTVTLTDTLDTGLVFKECLQMTASSGLSSDSLTDLTVCPTPIISNNGRTAAFDLGTLTNASSSNDVPETVTLKVSAVVTNVSANQRGVTLNNQAVWSWEGGSETVDSGNVTLLEPTLQVEKSESHTPPLDAGDTVTYTLVVSHTSASDTDAYDVSLEDLLPAGMAYVTGTFLNTAGLAPDRLDGVTLNVGWDRFPLGSTSTFTLEAKPSYAVAPNQVLTNTATLLWTSLPGDVTSPQTPNSGVSTERTGDVTNPGGAQNDYRASDTLDLTVEPIHPAKELVNTSEPSSGLVNGTQRVLIGEIVRYRLSALLPEGTSNALIFVDTLPAGMQFLDDSTAKAAFVSGNAGACPASDTIISSTLTPAVPTDPTPWVCGDETTVASILPTFSLPASALSVSGSDVTFAMGDLQNNDGDIDAEYVVVEFNALVTNVSANQVGTTLGNTFKVGFAGNYSESSDPISVTVAEPNLTIVKDLVAPAPQDAGDPITFRITVKNDSATVNGDNKASAFDVKLSDILPDYVDLVQLTDITVTKPTYAMITDLSSETDEKLDMTLDRLDPGDSLVVEAKAVLAADLSAGWIIDNTAEMTYTSLPLSGTLSPDNATGSVVPGVAGSETGERDGSNGTGSGLNNYAGSESEQFTTALPTIVKQPVTPNKYTIGEQVAYDILVTLPEGVTTALKVSDLLPAGLKYVSHSVITTQAAAGSQLSADFGGSALSATANSPTASGEDLTLDFGDVTVADDNAAGNNTLQVRVTAQVVNELGNQAGTTLNNQARLTYTNPNTGSVDTINSGTVAITVVEPILSVVKAVQTAPSPADAGGTLVYRVTITNAAVSANASTAYGVRFTDTINSVLTLGTITVSGSTYTNSTSGNAIDLMIDTIAPGASVTVTINTTINSTVQPYYNITNQGRITYSSLSGTVGGERDGSGGVNDYAVNSNTVSNRIAQPAISKTVSPTTYTIGQQVTYTILATLPEGTVKNMVITDLLPAGLKYVSHQVLTTGGALTVPYNGTLSAYTNNNPVNSGDDLVITFTGDVVTNADNVANNNRFQINVTAQVVNQISNQAGVALSNGANVVYRDPNTASGTRTNSATAVAVTVVEPTLSISKIVKTPPSPADAGGTLTYLVTITNAAGANVSTAYDVRFRDTLDSVLTLDSVTPSVVPVADASSGNTIDLTFASIAPGASVTLTINTTILSAAQPGQVIDNNGRIVYTSLSGSVTGERDGSGGINDYTVNDDAPSVTLDKPSIVKRSVTPDKYTIGEQVTYDLLVTLTEGTTNGVKVSDLLPTGLKYVSHEVISTQVAVGSLLSVDFGGSALSAVANSPSASGDDLVLDFGDVTVTNDNDAGNNTFQVRVTAQVVNESGNQSGATLNNQARLTYTNPLDGQPTSTDSGTVSITVLEPSLSITKAVQSAPNPADAGGTLVYQATISNAGGANNSTAYDVNFTDTLNSVLTPGIITVVGSTYTDNTSGNAVDLMIDSIAPDASVTVTINTMININAQPYYEITNQGEVTYTSLAGNVSGERDGTDGTGGLNDYMVSSNVVSSRINSPSITKTVTPANYTIGEQVSYTLLVNIPEGTAKNLVITDQLPAGLKFVSYQVLSSGGALTTPYNGTLSTTTDNAPANSGDDLTISFTGDVVTNANNDATDNTFQVTVTALVANEIGNQIGAVLDNNANVSYQNPNDIIATRTHAIPTQPRITIIEPRIATTKAVSPTTNVQQGDTLTYTVTFGNTGNSTAYEVNAQDQLPAGVAFGSLTSCKYADNSDAGGSASESGGVVTLTGNWDIAVGNTVTCEYTGTALISIYLDGTHTNTADADWSGLDGDQPSVERVYDDGTTYTVDGDQDTDQVSFSSETPTFAKSDGGTTTRTIGDSLTYMLTIGGPKGTLRGLVVKDTLPAGLMFGSTTAINGLPSVTPTVSAPNDGSAAVTVTWDFGDAEKTLVDAVITYTAVVADVASNQQDVSLINSATLNYNNAENNPQTELTGSDGFTLEEPKIVTSKDVSPASGVQAGDDVSYTVRFTNSGSVTAYDVTAEDALAQGVVYKANSAACVDVGANAVGVSVSVSGDGKTLTFDDAAAGGWDIPAAGYIQCTYAATAQSTLYLDGAHTNTIDADWSSQDGTANLEDRVYDDSGSSPLDNDDDVDDAVFTSGVPTLAKSDGGITTRTIGDLLTYTLTLNGPLGTLRNLVVQDALPAGLIYNNDALYDGLPAPSAVSVSTPNDGSAQVNLAWTFGDAYQSKTSATITFTGTVADVSSNQQSASLNNYAQASYTDTGGTNKSTNMPSDGFTLEEPKIVTSKDVSPASGVQAGDEVEYTVRFTNSGSVTAYDVTALDTLAQGVTYEANSAACVDAGANTVGVAVSVSGDGKTLSFDGATAGGWDIPASGYIQCTYTATAQSTLYLDGSHTNTVDADWSSQDGATNPEDRIYNDTGSSPLDNDDDADDAVFSSGAPTLAKSDGGITTRTIGDLLTYTLTIGGPNGTLRGLVVKDTLPAGLTYTGNPVITGLTPNDVTPVVSSPNDGSAAVTLIWNFGDAVKSQDEATITFSARAANVLTNQAGSILNNQVTLDYKAADGVTDQPQLSDQDDFTVQEPLITVDKSIVTLPDPLDAGGTVVYRVTISNPGGTNISAAYNVSFEDPLPTNLSIKDIVSQSSSGGVVNLTVQATGNSLLIGADAVPVGGTIMVDYSATILTVGAGAPVENTGTATWTSLDGPSANERDGSDGSGGLNDYTAEDSDSFTVSNPSITKSLIAPLNGLVTIGQIATYELAVSLPEGDTQDLVVTDTLPSGLAYVENSLALNTDAAHYNGTPAVPAYTFTPPAASGSGGGTLTVSFNETISLTGDNDPTNNILILRFQAVMLDIPANFGSKTLPVVLTNSASVQAGSGPLDTSNVVDVTVVEPNMEIGKSVLSPADGKIAGGDTVTFQLVVRNVGTSTAYDVVVEDPLPTSNSGILFDTFTRTDSAAGFSFETEVSGDDTIVRYSGGSIPADESVTFTFTANVVQAVPASTMTNTASVKHATTLDGTVTGERDEPEVQGTADLSGFSIDPAIDKDDSNATAVPGQPVIYTLAVRNDGNRSATGVTIIENAPANTSFDAVNSTPGWDCTAFPTCTFYIETLDVGVWSGSPLSFAITVNDPFPEGINSFTNSVSITDDGNNGDDADTDNNADSEETPVTAEPDLTISKTDGVSMTAPGAELTYTLTVTNVGDRDAKDVELVDTLPALEPNAQVSYVADSASDGGVYDAATGKITWPLFDLAGKGASVQRTFKVRVNDPQPTGAASVINTAEVSDNGAETNITDNSAQDEDFLSTSDKQMTATSQTHTNGLNVAIGEVLTYETTLNIPSEGADNVVLKDEMDAGLAFIGCEVIAGQGLSASPTAFDAICDNPAQPDDTVDPDDPEAGRILELNFGAVGNISGSSQAVTVRYTAAVLDSADNTRGGTLANHARWTWTGGELNATTPPVTIVEPTLTISKTAPKKTALPGGVVDYTITFGHSADSNADAFDVVLTDALPAGMSYLPGTLTVLSGPMYSDFAVTSTTPNRLTLVWDTLAQAETVTFSFSAKVRANLSGGSRLVNVANVEWTSLPGDYLTPAPSVPGPAIPQSPYNNFSTERYYDPASPVDLYGASSEFVITTPEDDSLPATGFAPRQITLLPAQPADLQYQDLGSMRIEIPSLGLNLPVTGVPLTESGWDLTWLGGQAGYLEGTAFPTWAGNSAITAHVFDANGQPGPFAGLNQLKWGDQIIIHFGGERYIYEMRSSLRVLPGDLSLLTHEKYPWLTLITCQGYDQTTGQYDWRYAVRAVQVRVEAE